MDPISLIMLAMIGVLIIFMVRNGRKRREMMAQLQDGMKPGAKVMLQSGIYGEVVSFDPDDDNRVTIKSGNSEIEVHRNAIGQIITPVDSPSDDAGDDQLAPDDDPDFGDHLPSGDDSSSTGDSLGDNNESK